MEYRKPDVVGDWKLRCPQCGYTYGLHSKYFQWEICPICGHGAPLEEFIVRQEVRDAL